MKYFLFVVLASLYPHLCKMNYSTIYTSTILHNLSNCKILILYWKCGYAPPLPRLVPWVEAGLVGAVVAAPAVAVPVVTRHPHHVPDLQLYLGRNKRLKLNIYAILLYLLTSPLHHGKAYVLGQPPAGAPPGLRRTRCRPET